MTDPIGREPLRHPLGRRRFMTALVGGLLVAPLAAEAQQAVKVWRLGMAGLYAGQYPPEPLAILKEALREKGYTEGRNLVLDIRDGDGTRERLTVLYRQLVNDGADVLIAHANVNVRAAKDATSKVPIVMLYALNPVGVGFVKSLGRPGGNVTGTSYDPTSEHIGKLVEFLKEGAPSVTRIGILGEPALYDEAAPPYWQAAENAARALHLISERFEMRRPEDVDTIFQSIAKRRMNGLVVFPSNILYRYRQKIVSLAALHRLPTVYGLQQVVEAGGLMSYGPDPLEPWRQAAIYIDRLLKGATPADLPVQQPTKMIFAVNLKTAKALGLTLPPSLLARADEVIE